MNERLANGREVREVTHPSKRKGNSYERELVTSAKESGLAAERAYASNGRSLGHHEEVDVLVAGKRIQAKRRKSLASFLRPTGNVDAVAIREDRGETMVVMTWWEYLDMLATINEARRLERKIRHGCTDMTCDQCDTNGLNARPNDDS